MRNMNLKVYKNLGFGLLTALLVVVAFVAFLTYLYQNQPSSNRLVLFALQHHLGIMAALVLISVVHGFTWASISYAEIERRQKGSRTMLDTVLVFLAPEERQLLNFLVSKNGEATQAEIARLEGVGRVKAHRMVKRMQDKHLVTVESYGKVRKVRLQQNILDTLSE